MDTGRHPIRLVKILGCELIVVDTTDNLPSYIAISHTWISADDKGIPRLLEDFGKSAKICEGNYTFRANLALKQQSNRIVLEGLKAIAEKVVELGKHRHRHDFENDLSISRWERWESVPSYFWIDAICLDQEDNDDKYTDLPYMGIIYQKAAAVICTMQPVCDLPLSACRRTYEEDYRWWNRVWTYQEAAVNKERWVLDKNAASGEWHRTYDCYRAMFIYSTTPLIEYRFYSYFVVQNRENHNEGNHNRGFMSGNFDIRNEVKVGTKHSLVALMNITRHRQAARDEDRIIGVLGLLDQPGYKVDLHKTYGSGMYGTLTKVLESLPREYAAEFLVDNWYPENNTYDIISRLTDVQADTLMSFHKGRNITGLSKDTIIMDLRSICVSNISDQYVSATGEVVFGRLVHNDGTVPTGEFINATFHHTAAPASTGIHCVGVVCPGTVCTSLVRISGLAKPVNDNIKTLKGFREQTGVSIWLICAGGDIYDKVGIAFITSNSLHGTLQKVCIR